MTKQLTMEKVQEAQALFEKLDNYLAILLQDKEEHFPAGGMHLVRPTTRPGTTFNFRRSACWIPRHRTDQEEQAFYQLKKKAVKEG